MQENKYFIVYQLEIIDGTLGNIQIYSKIISLNENEIDEDSVWNKIELPDNYKNKLLLSMQKL